VSAFFGGCGKFPDFFYRVFELPLYETPKNGIKKKSSKTTEGGKKTEKKSHTFCDEMDFLTPKKSRF
jgi:hypothetical protein